MTPLISLYSCLLGWGPPAGGGFQSIVEVWHVWEVSKGKEGHLLLFPVWLFIFLKSEVDNGADDNLSCTSTR